MKHKNKKGFTLFEVVIYIALLSIVTGGTLLIANNLIGGTEAIDRKTIVEEEANFILRKIEWALNGFDQILAPTAGNILSNISINKTNHTQNPIVFNLNSNNIETSEGGGTIYTLNSERVTIDSLSFEHINGGEGLTGVKTNIIISGKDYELTIYAKK